jgi:hypothetical protein
MFSLNLISKEGEGTHHSSQAQLKSAYGKGVMRKVFFMFSRAVV